MLGHLFNVGTFSFMKISLEFLSEMQFLESYPHVYNRPHSVSGVDFLYSAAGTQGLGPVSYLISQSIIQG